VGASNVRYTYWPFEENSALLGFGGGRFSEPNKVNCEGLGYEYTLEFNRRNPITNVVVEVMFEITLKERDNPKALFNEVKE
jgi:hypothetical protein